MSKNIYSALLLITLLFAAPAVAQVGINEDFDSLANWEPLHFSNISQHSEYKIIEEEKGNNVLEARSKSSASGLVLKESFEVAQTPVLRWRWKSLSVYQAGDGKTKSGDDYPIRVFVLFEYDPEKASLWTKTKYEAAKLRFGEYPPLATLNYVWANTTHKEPYFKSPYTDSAIIFPLDAGAKKLNAWQEHTVNILDDYRKAFGEEPPIRAKIAVMNDSDNTKESSVSYLDFLELLPANGKLETKP